MGFRGVEAASDVIATKHRAKPRLELADHLLDELAVLVARVGRKIPAGEKAERHEGAGKRAAHVPSSRDPAAKTGGNSGYQVGLDAVAFGYGLQDASGTTEAIVKKLGGAFCYIIRFKGHGTIVDRRTLLA